MFVIPIRKSAAAFATLLLFTAGCGQAEPARDPVSTARPPVPAAGPAKAATVITVFSDYRCGHCRAFHTTLEHYRRDNPGVRIVYRDWPVLGRESVEAARWAIASNFQDRHADFNAALMTAPQRMSRSDLQVAARTADLDLDRLHQDLFAKASDIDAILQSNDALARSYGLQGTPGIVIGDIIVPGAIDRATLDQVIARAGKQSAQPNQS